MSNEKCRLSDDLKLACEIYHYNVVLKKPIHFTLMVENLAWIMDKIAVSHSLDTLTDWMIAHYEYGSLGDGRAGAMWYIDEDEKHTIKLLYEDHWKNFRHELK